MLSDRGLLTRQIIAEVAANLLQDELDVMLSGKGHGSEACGGICCPGNGDSPPGQEEDDTTVTCGRVQHAHGLGAAFAKK